MFRPQFCRLCSVVSSSRKVKPLHLKDQTRTVRQAASETESTSDLHFVVAAASHIQVAARCLLFSLLAAITRFTIPQSS